MVLPRFMSEEYIQRRIHEADDIGAEPIDRILRVLGIA